MSSVTGKRGHTTTSVVKQGWADLGGGRWVSAREHFERALATAESASALEGLSWAAWWLDDEAAVFDARERAYRLYREQDDPENAARMAAWLASDALDFRGASAVASGWLRRAHRLLDPLGPSPAHGWLAFFEGYLALGEDDTVAAELGVQAADVGRAFAVPDLEMLGLALLGSTLVTRGRRAEGMRHLDEATATALSGECEVPISGAWACCFLVSACIAVRDFERAWEWCDRIADFAERYGSRYMLAFCRSEYGAVYLWRGRWSEAEAILRASADDYARSRPAMLPSVLVQQAELARRLGRPEEAATLLDEANIPIAALGHARLALDRGDALGARELVDRVLRGLDAERRLRRTPALELAVEARLALGDLDAAAEASQELRAIDQAVGTTALRAAADLAEGMVAAARGDHEVARRLLEDAVDAYAGVGAPYEEARARVALGALLVGAGRSEPAAREARRAVERLSELGAAVELERASALLAACAGTRQPAAVVTPRERDVLRLLADGLTNHEIAQRLVLSEHTVHRHVTNILRKLDLPSRAAAAAYAVRAGLVDADE
jgi:LuxR family transcriptional regulator, maltose regulon positive regulatory protein